MDPNDKPVEHLIVDSSVLIRRAPLKDLAQTVYAASGVVSEIRDANTRSYLQVLPFDFKIKDPTSDAIKFVTNFAKKTGDYSNLSAVDLQLLALSYQLCKENLTEEEFISLKLEPTKNNTTLDTSRLKLDKTVNIAGFYIPSKLPKTDEKKEETNNETSQNESTLDESIDKLNLNDSNTTSKTEDLNESANESKEEIDENNNQNETNEEVNNNKDENGNEGDENDDDDDDSGWINPSNIEQVKKASQVESEEQNIKGLSLKVACMTADFAMQNVLIQIGIPVLSVDGLLIKKARSYVFKCITCHKVTTDMSKVFCPNCGYKTLDRYVVTIDSDGNKVFKGRRKPLSTKGLRFSLPMPHGGKHPNYPQLSEDQPMAQNLPPKKTMIKNNPLDPDYICQSSPFAVKDVYSRASKLGIRSADQVKNRFNKRK